MLSLTPLRADKMLLTFGNYAYVRFHLMVLAIVAAALATELYEGDSCQMKNNIPGICQLQSNCHEIMEAIKDGTMSSDDPVHCSFWKDQEVICCPVNSGRKGELETTRKPAMDSNLIKMPEITTTTEKLDFWMDLVKKEVSKTFPLPDGQTTTPSPDFWLSLLTTTTSTSTTTTTTPKPLSIDLTTEKSDFWMDLVKKEISKTFPLPDGQTTTPSPEFWLSLLTKTTSTSTTTPKPLSIGGKTIKSDAEFIDLNQLLKDNRRVPQNTNENIASPSSSQWQNMQLVANPPRHNGIPNAAILQNQNRPNRNPNIPIEWSSNNNFGQNNLRNMRPIWNSVRPNNMPNIIQNPNQSNVNKNWNGPNNWNDYNSRLQNQIAQNDSPEPSTVAWSPNSNLRQNNGRNIQPIIKSLRPNNVPNIGQIPTPGQNYPDENTNWNGVNTWNGNPRNNNGRIIFNGNSNRDFMNQNQNIRGGNQFNRPNANTNWQNQNVRQQNNWQDQEQFPNKRVWQPNEPKIEDFESAASNSNFRPIKSDVGFGLPSGEIFTNQMPANAMQLNVNRPTATVFNNFVDREETTVRWARTTTTTTRTPLADPFAPFQFRPQLDNSFERGNTGVWNSDQRPNATATTRIGERPAVIACREIEASLSPVLTEHILDGTPVGLGEYPHMAALGYPPTGDEQSTAYDFRCGGALISNKFVLTAAHCVNNRDSTPAIVRLGAVNFTDPVELSNAVDIRIRKVHIHPNYSSSRKYDDIALLELDRDAPLTENISPTCLYTELEDPPRERNLYVTGWGTINVQTRQVSDILLKAKLIIEPLNSCNISYLENGSNRQLNRGVIETQLCAGDPGNTKDACQGDSGGPLNMVVDEADRTYRIVGVISTGFGCASSVPGLYTRVAAYLDYIEDIVWPNLRSAK